MTDTAEPVVDLEESPPDPLATLGIGVSDDDRLMTGFAAGLAHRLGVPPVYLRAAFVTLATVWGLGVVLYVAGVAATAGQPPIRRSAAEARAPQRRGLALAGFGVLLALRAMNLWPGDAVVWPVAALAFGAAFLVDQRDLDSREAIQSLLDPADRRLRVRTLLGVGLSLFGLVMLGSAAVPQIGVTMLAVLITGAGFVLAFGPWMWRLFTALGDERNERVRQEERAEMAAHLHDSVLQTLALIQRTDDPKRMVTLARSQERELRRWLYDRTPDTDDDRLSDALVAAAGRVEEDFDVLVEVVTVGDVPLTDSMRALAGATGEALTNAAKHAKTQRISLFSEATDEGVDVFVTDQGVGFELDTVDSARRGISDSIVGRMDRHGGSAAIVSRPGEGTEVHLTMPKEST